MTFLLVFSVTGMCLYVLLVIFFIVQQLSFCPRIIQLFYLVSLSNMYMCIVIDITGM